MKRIFFILVIAILCFAMSTTLAVAENETVQDTDQMLHGALIRDLHGALLRDPVEGSNDPFYLTPALRDGSTAELGDNTISPYIFLGSIGLASIGLIVTQKKLKQVS